MFALLSDCFSPATGQSVQSGCSSVPTEARMAAGSITFWVCVLLVVGATLFMSNIGSSNSKHFVVTSDEHELTGLLRRYAGIVDKLEHENSVLRGKATESVTPNSRAMLDENKVLRASVEALERRLRGMVVRAPAPVAFVRSPAPVSGPVAFVRAPAPVAPSNETSFTEERVKRVATNGHILLTFVNGIRLDFATTWVHHVRRLGMTNWLVGATDQTSLRSLLAERTPTFDMSTDLPEG